MKNYKTNTKEILIKFKKAENPKELDQMIYDFENDINDIKKPYYLKESENPYIYIMEYSKPKEIIKKVELNDTIKSKVKIIPVTSVTNNINHITSEIIKKIRNKTSLEDTYEVTCHTDPYYNIKSKDLIEYEISERIENIIHIHPNNKQPKWKINIYLVGDESFINIKKTKQHQKINT